MGGTSCDVALIRDGAPLLSSRGKIAERDLAVPMLDINTVSAGGGTIAGVDRFGALQVGPHSAGAVPGPACYGRGGEAPTITDCNLVLGYLGEDNFLGGAMPLDAAAARAAIEHKVARPLGLEVNDAAEGIVRIIDVKMAEAIKAISTMRGHDLRDFMLLAFGGAGPVHAGRLTRDLGMAGVIVPRYPGVFSAIGLIMSDVAHDYIQSSLTPLAQVAPADADAIFERLVGAGAGRAHRRRLCSGEHPDRARSRPALCRPGLRDRGPLPARADRSGRPGGVAGSFDHRHHAMFGHMAAEELVEIVSYRVRGIGIVPPVAVPKFEPTGMRSPMCSAGCGACVSMAGAGLPALSARAARCRHRAGWPGDPRPARLHNSDLSGPAGAG